MSRNRACLLVSLLVCLALSLEGAGQPNAASGDSLRAPALSMSRALEMALLAHRDVERARLSLREAVLARRETRLRLAPRLNLRLAAPTIVDSRNETWSTQNDTLRLVQVNWNQRRESGSLEVVHELPLATRLGLAANAWHRRSDTGSFDEEYGGSWSASLSQSLLPRSTLWGDLRESEREADQAELEALEELAVFRHQVAGAFLDLLRRQESLHLARQDLDVSGGNLERGSARYEAGLIGESDYLKVELDDLRLRASYQTDSLAAVQDGRDLMRLLGEAGVPAPLLDTRLPDVGVLAAKSDLDAALAAGSADLARQRLETRKAQRERRIRRLERLPDLELDAAWTWREEGDQWRHAPDEPRLDRSISLELNWPLFAGGDRTRAAERAGIHLRRQELRGRELEERLAAELERLWLRDADLRLQRPLLERQAQLAELDARISRERFQAGQITSRDLIDADRALSRARLQLLDLRISHMRNRLDLERLTGSDRDALRRELME